MPLGYSGCQKSIKKFSKSSHNVEIVDEFKRPSFTIKSIRSSSVLISLGEIQFLHTHTHAHTGPVDMH